MQNLPGTHEHERIPLHDVEAAVQAAADEAKVFIDTANTMLSDFRAGWLWKLLTVKALPKPTNSVE